MGDGTADSDGKAPLRSVRTDPEEKSDGESVAHNFREMRHSPEMIRELFRTGQDSQGGL